MVYSKTYSPTVEPTTSATCTACGFQDLIIGALLRLCKRCERPKFVFTENSALAEQCPWAENLLRRCTQRDWEIVRRHALLRPGRSLRRQTKVLFPVLRQCVQWEPGWTNPLPVLFRKAFHSFRRTGFLPSESLDRYLHRRCELLDLFLPIYREEGHVVGLCQPCNPLALAYCERKYFGRIRPWLQPLNVAEALCYTPTRDWKTLFLTDDLLSYVKLNYWFRGLREVHTSRFRLPAQVVFAADDAGIRLLQSYYWNCESVILCGNQRTNDLFRSGGGNLAWDRLFVAACGRLPASHIVTSPDELQRHLERIE